MKTIGLLAAASTVSAAATGFSSRNTVPPEMNIRFARQTDLGADTSCGDVSKDEPCTIIAASEAFEFYGERTPRDVADQLYERCINAGCENVEFEMSTRDITGLGPYETTLSAKASGIWRPEFQHALIFAMTELMGGTQEQYTKTEQRPPVQGQDVVTMEVWKAPRNLQINRYVNVQDKWVVEGSIALSVAKTEDELKLCDGLIGAVTTVASALSGSVGLALGAVKGVCAGT